MKRSFTISLQNQLLLIHQDSAQMAAPQKVLLLSPNLIPHHFIVSTFSFVFYYLPQPKIILLIYLFAFYCLSVSTGM